MMTGIRQASHFLASWDLFCGRGKWLDSALPTGGSDRGEATDTADVVFHAVRSRVAEEILWQIPVTIRRVADHIGPEAFTDREVEEEIPVSLRPLARTFRSLARIIAREVNHEIYGLLAQYALARPGLMQVPAPGVPQPQPLPVTGGDGTGQLAGAIAAYVTETVNRVVPDAVQRMAPRTQEPLGYPSDQFVREPRRERLGV
jgi:hypothetical protein